MTSIPLRIILHGLIALVPTTDSNGANHMTALLVNARMPSDEECAKEYDPNLRFLAAEALECIAVGCQLSGNQCSCGKEALARKQIRIEFLPALDIAARVPLANSPPPRVFPGGLAEAGDFSYVANLSQAPFGLSLNPSYRSMSPPQNLLARLDVPFETVTVCSLATREDAGEANVHAMSFRALHDISSKDDVSQSLAQSAILELVVPNEATQVTLHISDFDETSSEHAIKLLAGSKGYVIDLSNHPQALNRDDLCNDGIARHFSMFYDLAKNPPVPDKRLIPHVRFTQWENELSIPPICDEIFLNSTDRPICPMVRFSPE